MNLSSIISNISLYDLEILEDTNLNYLYVDTLAKETVLQQKIEPNRDYYVSEDYRKIYPHCRDMPKEEFMHIENLWIEKHLNDLDVDELCKITGINFYSLVRTYCNNICVVNV